MEGSWAVYKDSLLGYANDVMRCMCDNHARCLFERLPKQHNNPWHLRAAVRVHSALTRTLPKTFHRKRCRGNLLLLSCEGGEATSKTSRSYL